MGYFNEGYVWVSYKTGDYSTCTQLVDRRGYVYYETTDYVQYIAPIEDGITWIRVSTTYNDLYNDARELIIDTQGHVLYRTQSIETDTDSSSEHIIGYGNGKFLVIRKTTNINGEQYTLGTINSYGADIDPFWEAPDLYGDPEVAMYIQDDCFWYGPNLYDVVNQICIQFATIGSNNESNRSRFYEGYFFGDSYVDNCMDYVPFEEGQAHTEGVEYHTVSNGLDVSYDQLVEFIGGDIRGPSYILSELHYLHHGFYDLNGNRVIDIPQYTDLGMWCSDFNDEGYAMMTLEGADGYDYITVIDENLTEQFEPFRFIRDYLGPYNFSPYVLNGTFVCQTADGLCLYNVDGTLQRVLIEPIDPDEFITDGGRSIGVECFFDDYLIVHWYENSSRYDMYLFY